VLAPGARMVGIARIRAGLGQMTSDPALSLRFHAERVEVSASGDLAYTQGTYTYRSTDPHSHQPVDDHGSYVTTYRRQANGSWKAVDDIASSGTTPG
jgi:ketosteroid isomerase-like protein